MIAASPRHISATGENRELEFLLLGDLREILEEPVGPQTSCWLLAILDMLLSDGPLAAGDLRRSGPSQEVPWHVRLHDRSCMYYSAHLVAARKTVK